MHTTAVQEKKQVSVVSGRTVEVDANLVSWDEFEREYLTREDGFKYEWVAGAVEKSEWSMNGTQLTILRSLMALFRRLLIENKAHGELFSEPELYFNEHYRRPDVAWFTDEQIDNLTDPNARDVPAFVIEVISTYDQINPMKIKMMNYRDAGVQVVWHIFPEVRQVDVYSGPNLSKMTTCVGDEICSAAPALPGFTISVNDIFKKTQPA